MKELFSALKEDWNAFNRTEKIWCLILSPLILTIGICYGLWLLFWNKYGIAFMIAIYMTSVYGETKSNDVIWAEAQNWSLLIAAIMFVFQVYRKRDN